MQDEADELLLDDYNDARPYSNRSADFDQDEASVPSSAVRRSPYVLALSILPALPRILVVQAAVSHIHPCRR